MSDLLYFLPIAYGIGDILHRRVAADPGFHHISQILDRDLTRVPDIDHLAPRFGCSHQCIQHPNGVPHVAKGARLHTVAKDGNGRTGESLLNEARQDKTVITGLVPPDGIKKSNDKHRDLVFLGIGERLDLIGQLAHRITRQAPRAGKNR